VPEVAVLRAPDPAVASEVQALAATVSANEGREALREQQREALADGGPGWAGLVWRDQADGRVVGYAGVLPDPHGWALEYVTDGRGPTPLLRAALGVIAAAGGGRVQLWRSQPSARSDADAQAVGLDAGRDLLELRRPLPVGEPWSLPVRPFEPGKDEDAWLRVNNRAFAGHPEQGDWGRATIEEREKEPWFDPRGFLLHERDGRLAGFCWTKVHHEDDPPLGEIYVIGVDPDFGGHGLGRALVLAGLDHLAGEGIGTGMLYVDADNTAARRLYDQLGFTVHHVDRSYRGEVAPHA
jgi:mycothiol synthase